MQRNQIRYPLIVSVLTVPLPALAHDGHGNAPLHAVMHMLEQNGAAIGLLLAVGIGTLVWRAQQQRKLRASFKRQQERDRDTR